MSEIYNVGSGVKFYNVSYGVGDGMLNKSDDVMLVQWLLKRHFDRADKKAKLGSVWSINVINGVWDSMTSDVMKIYQYDVCLSVAGGYLALNGKAYPIQACGGLNRSALALLNLSVAGHHKQYYHSPKTDPAVYSEAQAMFERCGTI